MRVGLLGLGEAGSAYAAAFVQGGWSVHGYDPSSVPTPEGVERAGSVKDAVRDCALVLCLTCAHAAREAAREAAAHLSDTAVFADMNAAAPDLKRQIADDLAAASRAAFADVALIGSVLEHGHRAQLLASGPGATALAEAFAALGTPVEVLGEDTGAASSRKLLRSVFMKGLGALIATAVEAGRAAGDETWVRQQIAAELAGGDRALHRLYAGTVKHGERRATEVAFAADLLDRLGLDPALARAISQTHTAFAVAEQPRPEPLVSAELLRAHADVASANIGDASDRLGLLDSAIRPLWPGARAIGRALTVWTRAGDNKAIHEAIKIAQPGDLIVVNGASDTTRALIGELLAERAKARGVVGMVLDGAARDIGVLADIGFPVWARAVTPAGPYKYGPGHVNVPVAVGGIVCHPGDLVVADGDGVAVVPASKAHAVLAAARAVEADEAARRAGIRAGTLAGAQACDAAS
ncbi:DUF1932 domain-containing protein [Streptomyces sp. NPDC006332]|uniref:RraA family protein n=1 Tax=Streptomyces sp. NPDC006332 TaxID=3155456 RepID=UPI00339F48B3